MHTAIKSSNAFEAWNESLHSVCGDYETKLAYNSSLFIGEVRAKEHAGLPLAHLKTNAGLISRKFKPGRDDDHYCFLVSQRSGYSRIEQYGRTVHLAPGDIVLMDSARACDIAPLGLIEHASISLPREEVTKSLHDDQPLFGKVSPHCISGRMLRLLVEQLCTHEEGSNALPQECESMLIAFSSLLSSALNNESSLEALTTLPPGGLLTQIQRLIDDSLTHTSLTPALLAKRMNISVRNLYRLFEEQGDSVCRYIQRTRLQRSAVDLVNPRLRQESITTIAYKWGFTDSAHFSRAFKKQFGQSPKEYRFHGQQNH